MTSYGQPYWFFKSIIYKRLFNEGQTKKSFSLKRSHKSSIKNWTDEDWMEVHQKSSDFWRSFCKYITFWFPYSYHFYMWTNGKKRRWCREKVKIRFQFIRLLSTLHFLEQNKYRIQCAFLIICYSKHRTMYYRQTKESSVGFFYWFHLLISSIGSWMNSLEWLNIIFFV